MPFAGRQASAHSLGLPLPIEIVLSEAGLGATGCGHAVPLRLRYADARRAPSPTHATTAAG